MMISVSHSLCRIHWKRVRLSSPCVPQLEQHRFFFSRIKNAIRSVVGMGSEQDNAKQTVRNKNRDVVNSIVDKAIPEGTGLAGFMARSLMKKLGYRAVESIQQLQVISEQTLDLAEQTMANDEMLEKFLGPNISLGNVLASSASAVNFRNKATESMHLTVHVKGDLQGGLADITALKVDDRMVIEKIEVQMNDGLTHTIAGKGSKSTENMKVVEVQAR